MYTYRHFHFYSYTNPRDGGLNPKSFTLVAPLAPSVRVSWRNGNFVITFTNKLMVTYRNNNWFFLLWWFPLAESERGKGKKYKKLMHMMMMGLMGKMALMGPLMMLMIKVKAIKALLLSKLALLMSLAQLMKGKKGGGASGKYNIRAGHSVGQWRRL